MKKIFLIITFLISSQLSFANDVDFKNISIEFDAVIYSGNISNKNPSYKPFILTSSKSEVIGVLECRNSIIPFGNNYVFLTLTDRFWQSPSATAIRQMEVSDCQSITQSLIDGSTLTVETSKETTFYKLFLRNFLDMKLLITKQD